MTTINIGTNKGNIVGVEIDKHFKEIGYQDVLKVAKKHFGEIEFKVYGWCFVNKNGKIKFNLNNGNHEIPTTNNKIKNNGKEKSKHYT